MKVHQQLGLPRPAVSASPYAPYSPEMRSTEIVLLEVDPEHIHVYWHVRADTDLPPRPARAYLLRLHDLAYMDTSGANPHAAFDWRLTDLSAKAYLQVPGGGRSLIVELGIGHAYRRLEVLARSQAVRLPPLRGAGNGPPTLLSGALVAERLLPVPGAIEFPPAGTAPATAGPVVPPSSQEWSRRKAAPALPDLIYYP